MIVDDELVGEIGHGLLVYLGAGRDDSDAEVKTMAVESRRPKRSNSSKTRPTCSSINATEA